MVSNLGVVKPMVWLKSWIMMKKWYKPVMAQKDYKFFNTDNCNTWIFARVLEEET